MSCFFLAQNLLDDHPTTVQQSVSVPPFPPATREVQFSDTVFSFDGQGMDGGGRGKWDTGEEGERKDKDDDCGGTVSQTDCAEGSRDVSGRRDRDAVSTDNLDVSTTSTSEAVTKCSDKVPEKSNSDPVLSQTKAADLPPMACTATSPTTTTSPPTRTSSNRFAVSRISDEAHKLSRSVSGEKEKDFKSDKT
jgi:hypothetical protein